MDDLLFVLNDLEYPVSEHEQPVVATVFATMIWDILLPTVSILEI